MQHMGAGRLPFVPCHVLFPPFAEASALGSHRSGDDAVVVDAVAPYSVWRSPSGYSTWGSWPRSSSLSLPGLDSGWAGSSAGGKLRESRGRRWCGSDWLGRGQPTSRGETECRICWASVCRSSYGWDTLATTLRDSVCRWAWGRHRLPFAGVCDLGGWGSLR